ncbi:MAG: S1C family serine protease [Acidimicrobiales bacterium]
MTYGPHRRASLLVVVCAGALLLGACGQSGTAAPKATSTTRPAGSSANGSPSKGAPAPTSTVPLNGVAGAQALQQGFVAVAGRVLPQVVEIVNTAAGDLGSGIVYDPAGDIVTNDHVVGNADASTTFQVTFYNGQTADARLVGSYPADDLAVIKVSGAKDLHPATFGDSKAARVGDIVLAIGNPLGQSSSVTEGIVSYNGRTVAESPTVVLPSTIQTSAAINPGNSGGALVDLSGEVIGIPTLAAANQQNGGTAAGIGFAIPSDVVKLIAPQLISSGKVTNTGRAALGITAADTAGGNGVLVARVTAGGGADKAGIRPGDLITAVNGSKTSSLAGLQDTLAGLTPGQKAKVSVQSQNGSQRTVDVVLGQLPSQG